MIKRHIIAPFGAVGGNTANSDIAVVALGDVHGIRIASDSEIDVVDLYVDGDESRSKRIRVGVGAPWIGRLPDGTSQLRAVAVRGAESLSGSSFENWDGQPVALQPALILEFLSDRTTATEERLHPQKRAIGRWMLTRVVADGDSDLNVIAPVPGRTRITVVIHGTGTYAINGIDALDGNQSASSVVASGAVAGTAAQWVYEGPSYDWVSVDLTGRVAGDTWIMILAEDE